MKVLILVAHGSRRESSNEEVRRLAAVLDASDAHDFDLVDSAFLELAEPDIVRGLVKQIENGATEIRVVPYFLSAGRHVVEDVPADVEKVKHLYPEVDIQMMPYLGSASAMGGLVLELARG